MESSPELGNCDDTLAFDDDKCFNAQNTNKKNGSR